jgi:hypothetical protein
VNKCLKGNAMKKINVRKTETLKTTVAEYGCDGCPERCAGRAGDLLTSLLSALGLS